ncbi:uncharacterized protein LOC144444569 isoform X1 [Glandiceps talaboti]
MAEVAAQAIAEFEASARAGRRNALPDILDVTPDGKELTLKIAAMTLDESTKSDSACASPNDENSNKTETSDSDKKDSSSSGS